MRVDISGRMGTEYAHNTAETLEFPWFFGDADG